MTESQRSLCLLDSGVIDMQSIDRIAQAAVFFADSIAIRATYEVARSESARAQEIEWKLDSYRELGIVRFWAHEYEIDDGGYAHNPQAETAVRRVTDLVVERDSFSTEIAKMDEWVNEARSAAYEKGDSEGDLRQGTAEVVGFRDNLGSLVLSSELDQDGLLTNPAMRSRLGRRSSSIGYEEFQSAIARDVVEKLSIGPLSMLSADEIDRAKRYSMGFRRLLDEALIATSKGVNHTITPGLVADEIAEEYRLIREEFAPTAGGVDLVQDMGWDLLTALVPASLWAKFTFKTYRWRKRSKELEPFLLLMQLGRIVNEHRAAAAHRSPRS